MERLDLQPVYIIHIPRQEYDLFRNGLPEDLRLPPNYEDWEQATLATHRAHRKAGRDTVSVIVHWDDFFAQSVRKHMKPSYAFLTAYATSKGRKDATKKATRPSPSAITSGVSNPPSTGQEPDGPAGIADLTESDVAAIMRVIGRRLGIVEMEDLKDTLAYLEQRGLIQVEITLETITVHLPLSPGSAPIHVTRKGT
jgi:hypothetical protein